MVDLKHANVCSILGVCMQQRPWLAVLEYVQYGDLREVGFARLFVCSLYLGRFMARVLCCQSTPLQICMYPPRAS